VEGKSWTEFAFRVVLFTPCPIASFTDPTPFCEIDIFYGELVPVLAMTMARSFDIAFPAEDGFSGDSLHLLAFS
jgi:hypothetical protein